MAAGGKVMQTADCKSAAKIANLLQQCKRQDRYREEATAEATLMPSRALETMPPA